jgi:transposase
VLGYILSLQRQTQADQEARAAQAAKSAWATVAKPLDQQIVQLMRSLPPAVRDRPWSISELVARLEGKVKTRPPAQAVGQALRRLGWSRVRPFDSSGQGQRLWVPPL